MRSCTRFRSRGEEDQGGRWAALIFSSGSVEANRLYPSQNFSVTSRHIKPIITTLANSINDKSRR
jgi:hypothetical protein